MKQRVSELYFVFECHVTSPLRFVDVSKERAESIVTRRWYLSAKLHGVAFQNTVNLIAVYVLYVE